MSRQLQQRHKKDLGPFEVVEQIHPLGTAPALMLGIQAGTLKKARHAGAAVRAHNWNEAKRILSAVGAALDLPSARVDMKSFERGHQAASASVMINAVRRLLKEFD